MKTSVILYMPFRAIGDFVSLALRDEGAFEVAARVMKGQEILDSCARLTAPLVIADLKLPDMPLPDLVRRLRSEQPGARVVVFSRSTDVELTREVLAARPHGFAHLSEPMGEFIEVIRSVMRGGRTYSPFASRMQDVPSGTGNGQRSDKVTLNGRETEVLKLLARGKSSKEIGAAMELAPKTVDHYRNTLMSKLNIHDAVNLTRYAISSGIVSLEEGKKRRGDDK